MKARMFVVLSVLLLAGVGSTISAQQPAGTVAVNFSVDDRANHVYGPGDLKWKGSFLVDSDGVLTFDPTWSGAYPGNPALSGWPTLYDDGPWTQGGHEPIGSKAKDHIWGTAAFVAQPVEGTLVFEYGLIDVAYEIALGNGWVWQGPNGSFAVDAGATASVDAVGMTFKQFGKTDLRLTIDTNHLAVSDPPWNTSTVEVRSSVWGWGSLSMSPSGGGIYTLDLSTLIGRQGLLPHTGLLSSGDIAAFDFVLGGYLYSSNGQANTEGLAADVSFKPHKFVSAPIRIDAAHGYSYVEVP